MADVAIATGVPAWLVERRESAAALAAEVGMPKFKGRSGWEFTDLRRLDLAAFTPAGIETTADEVTPLLVAPEGSVELRQVDGLLGATPSLPDGVLAMPLDDAIEQHPDLVREHLGAVLGLDGADLFSALAEAEWAGGAFVHVPRGVRVAEPILLTAVSAAAGTAMHRRVLLVVEDGAEAEVWESLRSASEDAETVVNVLTEVRVGQNARLRYVCAQELNERSWIFGTQRAEVARDGALDWVALGFGSARGRIRMETILAGPGAEGKVTGAYAPHARQHVEYDTTQEHEAPNCVSDLAFRGVLADRSTAVWRGMIKVDHGAQKTDAFQECRNLLVSTDAHADAIPGLEILADDVRCTHAAAVAQIDPDQVFYLRSRGIPEPIAMRLVIEGFLAELVQRWNEGPLRDAITGALERRLEVVLG